MGRGGYFQTGEIGPLFTPVLTRCRRQAPGQRFAFRHRVYSLDATVIDLCLKVFDWAKFRKRKGAIKLHLILDHAGHIPSFCVMTPGREHEIEVARGQLLRTGQHPDV